MEHPVLSVNTRSSYLRFSSQTYNLNKLHESIHLTNNSIQCKYTSNTHDPALPTYLMWDSNEFNTYLSNIGYPNMYKKQIYGGMKECITAAVLMLQEKLDKRKNCFELYGADFMVTEDFNPWLLEINSNPALYASTPITKRMCPIVLEDVIKVMVDFKRNPKASTGNFELIYKQDIKTTNEKKVKDLKLSGCAVSTKFLNNMLEGENPIIHIKNSKPSEIKKTKHSLNEFGKGMKKTLENLLELIRKEKQRKMHLKNKYTEMQIPIKVSKESNCNLYLYKNYYLPEVNESDTLTTRDERTLESITENICTDSEEMNISLNEETTRQTLDELLSLIKIEKMKRDDKRFTEQNANSSKIDSSVLNIDLIRDVIIHLQEEGNTEMLEKMKSFQSTSKNL